MKAIERLERINTVLDNAGWHYNAMIDSIETLDDALELIDILKSEIAIAQDELQHIL